MPYNFRIVSTYPPRTCGIGTFSRDLANALKHFTGEVGSVRIAAIDHDNGPYHIPVDLVIDQYNEESWSYAIRDIIVRAHEAPNPTVVLLQHEYGLDPSANGEDGRGTHFVKMAHAFSEHGLLTLVYLHTILDEPNEHQRKVLQALARTCDGVIVTTRSAIGILSSAVYGINPAKLKHIDHGIRMQNPSLYNRLALKEELGLAGRFLITTLGLLSPDKGVQYSIRGYTRFLQESCTDHQRKKIVYLIAGQCHPDFMAAGGGQDYRRYLATLTETLEQSGLTYCKVKELAEQDFADYDLVLLDTFVDERTLLKLYGATDAMLLPYLNMQQISSGILADTVGAGRVAIATKFRYALELIHSNGSCPRGVVVGRYVRGILVDPGEPSVEQIAQALDCLNFDKGKRLRMEKQAHRRGCQMKWHNTAWTLLQHIELISEEKEMIPHKDMTFKREKPSIFQNGRHRNKAAVMSTPVPPRVENLPRLVVNKTGCEPATFQKKEDSDGTHCGPNI